jgi:hypothetical protein
VRPLHLVLDASAVEAYARGDVNVGEPLAEVVDNDAAFAAPLNVLAAAGAVLDPVWITLLASHPSFAPVDTAWSRWRNLATSHALLGRLDAVEALLVALDADCDVLTAEPEADSSLGADPPVIGV